MLLKINIIITKITDFFLYFRNVTLQKCRWTFWKRRIRRCLRLLLRISDLSLYCHDRNAFNLDSTLLPGSGLGASVIWENATFLGGKCYPNKCSTYLLLLNFILKVKFWQDFIACICRGVGFRSLSWKKCLWLYQKSWTTTFSCIHNPTLSYFRDIEKVVGKAIHMYLDLAWSLELLWWLFSNVI